MLVKDVTEAAAGTTPGSSVENGGRIRHGVDPSFALSSFIPDYSLRQVF
jgi:hypothetical protein